MKDTKKEDIFAVISSEVTSYEDAEIKHNPTFAKTMPQLLNLIDLYENSQYLNDTTNELGLKLFFYNIINYRCALEVAHTDIDTKDIRFIAETGQSHYPVWLFQKEFAVWAKDKEFSQLWNEMCELKTKYGSVVVKKVGNKLVTVLLQNLFMDPEADNLKTSDFIIERHPYTYSELERQTGLGWDKANIDKVLTLYRNHSRKIIPVYERYGLWKETEEGELKRMRHIVAGIEFKRKMDVGKAQEDVPPGSAKPGQQTNIVSSSEGIIIDSGIAPKIPYYEHHRLKLRGRWLGRGKPEELFEAQIRENDLINLKAKSLNWTSLQLFQSADELVKRNLLQMAKNGDIINSDNGIKRIETEERDLSAFNFEFNRWDKNADDIGFTHAPIMGEAKAGTPLGLGALQAQLSASFYNFQKEKFGLFIKKLLFDVIIPQFKNAKSKKHLFNFVGEDEGEFNQFIELITNSRLNAWIDKRGSVPTLETVERQRELISSKLRQGGALEFDVPAEVYKNIKYKMDIVITGESIDLSNKTNLMTAALQMLGSNPNILKDPTTKKIFFKLLEAGGVSPIELEGSKLNAPAPEEIPLGPAGSPPKTSEVANPAVMPKSVTL